MQYPSNLPVCLSQYLYSKTPLKENLHHNEGTNSQMLTQNVRFNYDAIFLDACVNLLLFTIMKQGSLSMMLILEIHLVVLGIEMNPCSFKCY